jgi:hypothetical protein
MTTMMMTPAMTRGVALTTGGSPGTRAVMITVMSIVTATTAWQCRKRSGAVQACVDGMMSHRLMSAEWSAIAPAAATIDELAGQRRLVTACLLPAAACRLTSRALWLRKSASASWMNPRCLARRRLEDLARGARLREAALVGRMALDHLRPR